MKIVSNVKKKLKRKNRCNKKLKKYYSSIEDVKNDKILMEKKEND